MKINKKLLSIMAIVLALSLTLVACGKDELEGEIDKAEDKIEKTGENVKDAADKTIADIDGHRVAKKGEPVYKPELIDKALNELNVNEDDVLIVETEYEIGHVAEIKLLYNDEIHKFFIDYDEVIAKHKTEKLDDIYAEYEFNFDQLFAIALKDSGLNSDDLDKVEIALDDDGEKKVEIELRTESEEFDYKLNPDTGDILEKEVK